MSAEKKFNKLQKTFIRGGYLVLPDRVVSGDLRIHDGIIQEIGQNLHSLPDETILDGHGNYILPGFIDIHNHGAQGFDFSLGNYQPDRETFEFDDHRFQDGVSGTLLYFLHRGATRILATTLAAPVESLKRSLARIAAYKTGDPAGLAVALSGINLEGTFIKEPAFAGAQNPEHFQKPSIQLFDTLQDAAQGWIRIVNLPPEHGLQGMALQRHLIEQQVLVAGGHSAAYGGDTHHAIDAGLSLAVHYFNGPSRQSFKSFHRGGAMEAMLTRDEVSLELIVDGYHIDPAYVRDAISRKGFERVIAITDSLFINGRTDIHQFSLAGIPGVVSSDREYLQVKDRPDTLFGSILTPIKGFSNLLNWLTTESNGVWVRNHPALPFDEALIQISRMMSANPAQLLGLDRDETDASATGKLAAGYSADILIADIRSSSNHQVELKHCFLAGKMIF